MKILQVQFKNRNGHTLRGIVTLPDTEGKVPFVVHLHGFAGSLSLCLYRNKRQKQTGITFAEDMVIARMRNCV